jgi:hypothetical protein
MQFQFVNANGLGSGYMAFTDVADSCYYLLVTDAGHDAVHVIDVVAGKHMGYVAAPGAIAGPRGVATKGCRVAISSGVSIGGGGGDHVVRLFEGSGAAWTPVRELVGGHAFCPRGLRFTATGTHLVVADTYFGPLRELVLRGGRIVCAAHGHWASWLSDRFGGV